MSELAHVILLLTLAFNSVLAIGLASCIWVYLSKKPLGMQTIFDVMIKDLLLINLSVAVPTSLVNVEPLNEPWRPETAIVILLTTHTCGVALIMQAFTTVLVRYLTIFHGTWINQLREASVIWTSRMLVLVVSVVSAALEWCTEDMSLTLGYQHMTGQPVSNHHQSNSSTVSVMALVLIFVIFVQIKIEWWVKCKGNLHLFEELRTNRFGIIMIICLSGSFMAWMFLAKDASLRFFMHVYIHFISTVLLPLIFILRSPNIKNFISHVYTAVIA